MSKNSRKGPLTIIEKAAIQGLVSQQKTPDEIAVILDRSVSSVNKYIDVELDNLHSTIVNAQMEASENESDRESYARAKKQDIFNIRKVEKIDTKEVTDDETITIVTRRLKQAGLKDIDIQKVMDLAINRFVKMKRKFQDENELYTECIRQMKAGEFIIKKTDGGRDGIAIMTPAASQRTDEGKSKRNNNYSRIDDKNIFRPNG